MESIVRIFKITLIGSKTSLAKLAGGYDCPGEITRDFAADHQGGY